MIKKGTRRKIVSKKKKGRLKIEYVYIFFQSQMFIYSFTLNTKIASQKSEHSEKIVKGN